MGKKSILMLLAIAAAGGLTGAATAKQINPVTLSFNSKAWHYDEQNAVYYQLGVPYAATPEVKDIEVLNIYVPAAYFDAKKNADGTYTTTVNTTRQVHGYTAATAPVLFPLETPGYVLQRPQSSYNPDGVTTFTAEGFVYVFAGMRGRNNGYNADGSLAYNGGAPWGITDLKAAVRYIRYNADVLPGDTAEFYTAGMSGGGAQSALMGATGDSPLYTPYLAAIGAAMTGKDGKPLSDAVAGSMDWCPITSLDYADEAYEWNMGQFSSTGIRTPASWKSALSQDLAAAWAAYFNRLGLTAPDGTKLQLEKSKDGIYQAGTYYTYLKGVVETSLEQFLSDTSFPYTVTKKSFNAAVDFGGGESMLGLMQPGQGSGQPPAFPAGALMGGGAGAVKDDTGVTYATAADYIASLNKDGTWVTYDKKAGTVKITSLKDFVIRLKQATKGVGAFDDLNLAQAENSVFGTGASDAMHFDMTIASLVKQNSARYAAFSDWTPEIIQTMTAGIESKDSLGTSSIVRQNMYNPLYYLCSWYDGYGSATVARHWRIRTGIEQSDTALTTEVNLALALESNRMVKDVDFATVWNMQHTMAERTGTSIENLILWIHQCVAQDARSKQ